MVSLLRKTIAARLGCGDKLLSIYLTAGYPTPEATLPLLDAIVAAGADMVELGIPFSDPLADGPTIQNASQAALSAGMTLKGALRLLGEFRRAHETPAILMGYSNPFQHFGWELLLDKALQQGASGFIIPDLPPEESADLCKLVRGRGLDLIFLVAPNTPRVRIELINELAGGFIYAVTLTGITGAREKLPPETLRFLQDLRKISTHPILAGFGIANAETARRIAPYCDGVIVGSAVIHQIAAGKTLDESIRNVAALVSDIKAALH